MKQLNTIVQEAFNNLNMLQEISILKLSKDGRWISMTKSPTGKVVTRKYPAPSSSARILNNLKSKHSDPKIRVSKEEIRQVKKMQEKFTKMGRRSLVALAAVVLAFLIAKYYRQHKEEKLISKYK